MKILHVLDHSLPESSGYSLRSHAIIRAQRARGWQTMSVTSPKQSVGWAALDDVAGIEYRRIRSTRPRWAVSGPVGSAWLVWDIRHGVRDAIKEFQPDVVHAHSPCTNGLACLGLGVPLVYEMRTLWEDGSILAGRMKQGGMAHRFAVSCESFVLNRADGVVVISEGLRQNVLSRGVPADRVVTVGNAVDAMMPLTAAAMGRDAARQRFGLGATHVLGYVGSLFGWEGLEHLLHAARVLNATGTSVDVLIVGSGPEEASLRKVAERLGVGARAVFTGRVNHDAALAAYAAIDILVYPRLPMRLTDAVTPLKPLEAMAMGKTVVASDVGGHRELIDDGVTGLLYPAGDVAGLTSVIERLVADDELAARLQKAGRECVLKNRTWAATVASYEDLYERLRVRGNA